MVEEVYVSFETAKLLKEKGFDEPCHAYYEDNGYFLKSYSSHAIRNITNPCFFGIAAPTQQMTMRWLREVHNLHVDIDPSEGDWNPTVITLIDWTCAVKFGDNIPIQKSYEEAVEAAIQYSLKNLI